MRRLRLGMAQINTTVGDFKGNTEKILEAIAEGKSRGVDILTFPELATCGWLALTTGNKSKMATGYTTLYDDMAGEFAVIKDMSKTIVYQLAKYRNALGGREPIPSSVFEKPPSAELRPDQKDTDSLPPYDLLDPVLKAYVEEDKSVEQISALGIPEEVIKKAARLVDSSEYKRRQAPPGVKIIPRAFGRDRRLLITNHFKGY